MHSCLHAWASFAAYHSTSSLQTSVAEFRLRRVLEICTDLVEDARGRDEHDYRDYMAHKAELQAAGRLLADASRALKAATVTSDAQDDVCKKYRTYPNDYSHRIDGRRVKPWEEFKAAKACLERAGRKMCDLERKVMSMDLQGWSW
jgi:hypothetical protein